MEAPFESIRLFMICEAMSWAHLPVAGGIYDQHPRLLEDWMEIFRVKREVEEQKAKQAERQQQQRRRPA